MTNTKTLEDLKVAVLEGDDDLARELAEKSLKEGIDPNKVMNEGIIPGIVAAGELWKTNDYFQTDIILCAEAFRLAMEIVEPKLSSGDLGTSGTIVIGTLSPTAND
ncbi:unnamed protein product, partial [marine sediment metagenome]